MGVMDAIYLVCPVLLLLPPLLLFLALKHVKSSFVSETHPLPPGPNPWPILGNIPHMTNKPHITLANFAKSYGPLISLRLGTQILIVGSSKAAAVEILKTHDCTLSGRHVPHAVAAKSPEHNHLSLGWALECNDQWNCLRTICRTELFSGKAIGAQACLREEKVREMVEFLRAMEGKEMKLGEVVFATLFNMFSNVLMSRDFIGLEEEICTVEGGMRGLIRTLLELFSVPNLSDFYPIFGALDLQGLHKKANKAMASMFALWEPIIEERRARKRSKDNSTQQDFLDALLDNAFTNDQINNLLGELILAGVDTSATTIEWAMAELLKNPECLSKVQQELAREINQDFPKELHLPKLSYLQACVKETLRVHTPAPFMIPHRAVDSCDVMDYTIPKDAQVIVNVWAIARDPTIWEDPLQFNPDRFLNSALDFKGKDFEFLPFGSGRRMCPGLPMASKLVPLVLGSLIHTFDWSLPLGSSPSDIDMSEKFAISLRREQPLVLIPKLKK